MSMHESSQAEKLKAAIMEADLAPHEIRRRLVERVEIEYEKGEQADIRLIDICERMLAQLEEPAGEPFVSHKASIHQKIDEKGKCKTRNQHSWYFPIRVAAVATAIWVCLSCIGSLLHWEWLGNSTSYDGQQHTIQGYEIGVDTIHRAIAEHEDTAIITINDVHDFYAYLGFEPGIPETVGGSWLATTGNVSFFPNFIQVGMKYVHRSMPNRYVTYVRYYFLDMENAYIAYEQNCAGEKVELSSGVAYISTNEDNSSACWQQGIIVSLVTGTFKQQEGIEIIKELCGGIKK